MTEFIKSGALRNSELLQRRSVLLFSIFLFLTSIFCGFFFSLCLSDADQSTLTSPIGNLSHYEAAGTITGLFINLFLLAVITVSALSLYCFPVIPMVLFMKGTALGFCAGLIPGNAPVSVIISFAISCFLLIPSFTAAAFVSLNYALSGIARRSTRQVMSREFLALILIISLPTVIASIAEAFILQLL